MHIGELADKVSPPRRRVRSICVMPAPTPYIHLPGTVRDALTFYGDVFGCSVQLQSFDEINRTDGPADAIAHGYLVEGSGESFCRRRGRRSTSFPLRRNDAIPAWCGRPSVLRNWFSGLSEGGRIVDDLQSRPWGATDGQVIDRYGLHWLIGFEGQGDH
jgi:PhnB protein